MILRWGHASAPTGPIPGASVRPSCRAPRRWTRRAGAVTLNGATPTAVVRRGSPTSTSNSATHTVESPHSWRSVLPLPGTRPANSRVTHFHLSRAWRTRRDNQPAARSGASSAGRTAAGACGGQWRRLGTRLSACRAAARSTVLPQHDPRPRRLLRGTDGSCCGAAPPAVWLARMCGLGRRTPRRVAFSSRIYYPAS
jgi:hypothetical protein